jgi:hypothetical protein
MQVSPLGPASGRGFLSGARTTSLVVLGLWAVARTAESGFALWVRSASSAPPPE